MGFALWRCYRNSKARYPRYPDSTMGWACDVAGDDRYFLDRAKSFAGREIIWK